jgi:hypothetical protein
LLLPALAVADMGPPAHMQVTETDDNLYAVQWRVPKVLPPRAVPSPELPEHCQPTGEGSVVQQPAAWFLEAEWRCETGLAGEIVGLSYPYPDLALTTVIKVDLLSGDRFAHVLTPGDEPWRLPEGTAAPDLLRAASNAVLAGVTHTLGSWVHIALLLALAALADRRQIFITVTAITIGQIVGAIGAGMTRTGDGSVAEIAIAVAAVVLARQALAPSDSRVRLAVVGAAAGLVHGWGLSALVAADLGDASAGLVTQLFAVLGIDAVHLVIALAIGALWARRTIEPAGIGSRKTVAYLGGAAGVALAIGIALAGGTGAGATESVIQIPDATRAAAPSATPGSQRVAPATPNAPVQSYLTVEPFEIRHEVMLRLAGLTAELGLDPDGTLTLEDQPAIRDRCAELVGSSTLLIIDGTPVEGVVRRTDFMVVDATGALPRTNPIPETVAGAVLGVILSYPTTGMPTEVQLEWTRFLDGVEVVPATAIDPETVASALLNADEPRLVWTNALMEDPIPSVDAIPVEPAEMPIPWLALPLVVLAGWLLVRAVRGRETLLSAAAVRIVLAIAILVSPLVQTAVALPGSAGRTPSERQARRILAGLLPNIYRALEFRDEAVIYDRLAISVEGDALTDVYLEQRRALEVEERGGAQARVEAVEVLEATEVAPGETGFAVRGVWTVGGMVTHFGHRHFRQNRYDALIEIVPVDGAWKIAGIEVLEQDRLK